MQRPAHLEENTAAYGSIRNFYGKAQVNHDGSKLLYVATADDRGRSVFLCDTRAGTRQPIIEDTNGVGIWNDDFDIQAGPWSPDDSSFVCKLDNELLISAPEKNKILARLQTGTNAIASEVSWLSSSKLAWREDGAICFADKGDDGGWTAHRLPYSGQMTNFTGIDSHTVAWLQDHFICRLDLSQDFSGKNNSLASQGLEDNKSPVMDGLVVWLDASTLQLPDQALVTELADLSPRKNNAVSNQNAPKFNGPKSGNALNGKGTISFSSSGDFAKATGLVTTRESGINGNKPRTVFTVLRREVGRSMIVGLGNAGIGGSYFGVADQFDGFYLPSTMDTDGRAPVLPRNWNILSVVHDGSSQKGYVNGDLKITTAAQLSTADAPLEIGLRTVATGEGSRAAASDGAFAEVLVYDRALTEPERRRVEGYLSTKYFNRKLMSAESPLVWFNLTLSGLTGLTYSRENGEFLISCTEKGHDSIWRLSAAAGPKAVPTEILQGQSLRGAQWAGANAVAYTNHLDTRNSLVYADLASGNKKELLKLWANGSYEWFNLSGDHKQIFLFGNLSNTPAAELWQCDIASGKWRSVVSASDHPFGQAVLVQHETMAFPGGDATVTTYRPANFDKKKKYPLVIGDTMITDPIYGEPFMTGMAACGAVVAVVERPWWTVGIEQWGTNVQALYDKLQHDPTLDRQRVYLFGASAETHYLSQLVETNTAPWRGLILLNPGQIPNFSKSPQFQLRPKMLLDAGGEEHDENRFKKIRKDCLNWGVVVEFYTHPGETHRMVGTAPKLERANELKHFIFEE